MKNPQVTLGRTVGAALFGCGLFLQPAAAAAQDAVADGSVNSNPSGSIAIGGDVASAGYAIYAAGSVALNGDLYADGVLVRAAVGAGEYKSGTNPIAGVNDVNFYSVGAQIGYQANVGGGVNIAGFVGPELVHNGEDAEASVRGSEWAARFTGELFVPSRSIDFGVWGTYSTFENQYFVSTRAMGHIGRRVGLGPELALFGGDGWQRSRAGLHLTLPIAKSELGIGGGYDWDLQGDVRESAYGSIIFNFPF